MAAPSSVPSPQEKPEAVERLGFGEYTEVTESKSSQAARIAKIAGLILLNLVVIGTVVVTAIFSPLTLLGAIPAALIMMGFSIKKMVGLCLEIHGKKNMCPSTTALNYEPLQEGCPKLNEWDTKIEGSYVLKDSIEKFNLTKEIVQNAEQEILISGNYIGGKSFDELLDLIADRMREKPELRVYIIASDRYVSDGKGFKNWEKLQELTGLYPDRFHTAFSTEMFVTNPDFKGTKFSGNHTKMVVADRKVMLTGGTALEDRWSKGDGITPYTETRRGGLIEKFVAATFRDKDVMLWSGQEKTSIDRSAIEFYKLFTRWHHYTATRLSGNKQIKALNAARGTSIEAFHDFHEPIDPNGPRIAVDALTLSEKRKAKPERAKILVSGPEHTDCSYEDEVLEMIENAKDKIVIAHAYFHPTEKVMQALIQKREEGVEIIIYTCGKEKGAPKAHGLFYPHTLQNIRRLNGRKECTNLTIYAWKVPDSTYHQKMLLVDDQYVLMGSSNFSYKGLDSMSDYEHNAAFDSEDMAARILRDLEKDRDQDRFRELPKKLVRDTFHPIDGLMSGIYSLAKPLIG